MKKRLTLFFLLLLTVLSLSACYSFPMHDDQGNKIDSAQEAEEYMQEKNKE